MKPFSYRHQKSLQGASLRSEGATSDQMWTVGLCGSDGNVPPKQEIESGFGADWTTFADEFALGNCVTTALYVCGRRVQVASDTHWTCI